MNVTAYLQRIRADAPASPDLAALAYLQLCHLLAVPFENLSVVHREPIVLEELRLYNKIVIQCRGGFCYELNGLFAWLLRHLGYQVDRIAAEVYSQNRQEFGPPFDHMALVVHLERPYLVDVGFGDSARKPLALPDGRGEDASGAYRVKECDGALFLQKQTPAGWSPQYRFTLAPHELADYAPMCVYHCTSPGSHFTRGWFCSRATPDGRITLTSDELVVTTAGVKTRTPVAPNEHAGLLRRHFDLEPGFNV
jgi:N-hydroxyarylamine O-acetyltransferase